MEKKTDWSIFNVRVNVNAPVDALYKAWATPKGIEHWFLRQAEYKGPKEEQRGNTSYVEKGDSYTWRWFGYPDTVTEKGSILDLNGRDFFKFSFGKAGNCSVTIKQEHGETIVELVQDNIPVDDQGKHAFYVGCKTGWTFYLANLKSLFEGGIDLRNKNEQLTDMINS